LKPPSEQLVRSALSAVARAQRHPTYVDIPATLDGVATALNELLLRQDEGFFRAFVTEGVALAAKAETLLGTELPGAEPDASEGLSGEIDVIAARNAAAVNALAAMGGAPAAALTDQIVQWELGLYAKRAEDALSDENRRDALALMTSQNFERYLHAKKPEWPDARVTAFKLQPGGYSKITVLVSVEDSGGIVHEIVIRAEPARRMLDLDGMAIASEYPLVRYAFEAGLPAAEPLLLETDTSWLGMQFMMSRKVGGRVLGSMAGSDSPITEDLVKAVLALVSQIANTPVDPDSPLIQASHLGRWIAKETLAENTREFIEYWRDVGTRGNSTPSALLNYAVNWLLANVPEEDARPNLIHGDVGFHNVMFEEGQLSALLDWENARYGDTAEELSMFVSSIAHLYTHDQILGWYHDAGGPHMSEWRLRYFDVYMAMKIVVSAQVSLQRVQESPENNLHLAVFGLRYLYMIGSRLGTLIAAAEAVKPAHHTVNA
jgi:aminoglycoside phosphotransferase (APT) family kinase protein